MDWQPIETAPRDGRGFLAFAPDYKIDGGVVVVRWVGAVKTDPYYEWMMQADSECDGIAVSFETSELTHWMPLPPPPTEAP